MTRIYSGMFSIAAGCLAILAMVSLASLAEAQTSSSGEPFAGFSAESDEPIRIEADELEVFDREKKAIFKGNVKVVQGNVNMTASTLTVYYSGEGTPGATTGSSEANGGGNGQGSSQQIRRIEAEGEVIVTSEDQKATGQRAVYETANETVTLTGDIVLSQGPNVLRGDRLIVNLASGQSRVESDGGRVQGLFAPNNRERR